MQNHSDKPTGTRLVPSLICTLTGVVLAICLEKMMFFAPLDSQLLQVWETAPFYLTEPFIISVEWGWVMAFLMSWGVAYVVLDSLRCWRKWLLLFMVISLCLCAVPTLVLWGVLWSPMSILVAVVWAWSGAFFYACQHRMPCEGE